MTDKQPFSEVVCVHGPTVLRVCRAVVGPVDADDAWSETFLSALRAYPKLSGGANVEAWLVTIAHRKVIDLVRKSQRSAIPVSEVPAEATEGNFDGRRTSFDLPIDLRLSAGFRRSVLSYLPTIRYGETASYHSVAVAVHNPKAVRAVGTACATNPLPIVIPCHRVIRSDGQPGAYLGGPEIKHQLLDMEAHR